MISKANSERVTIVSYLATIMVVLIHAGACSFSWFTDMITQWAVPWFLVVAGYFYYYSFERSGACVLKKKVRTLLVPYFLWSMFGVVCHLISGGEVSTCWLSVIGITQHPFYNQPLWFIRSLFFSMAVIVIGRTIGVGLKLSRQGAFLASIIIFLLFFIALVRVPFFVEMPASPFYFLIGYVLGKIVECGKLKFSFSSSQCVFLPVLLIFVAGLFRATMAYWGSHYSVVGVLAVLVRNVSNLLIIPAVWLLANKFIPENLSARVLNFFKTSFFVYCIHFPIVVGLVKLWRMRISSTPCSQIFMMILITVFVVTAGSTLALYFKKFLPRVYCCLTGGRE